MQILFADETDKQEGAEKRLFFCISSLAVEKEKLLTLSKNLEEIKTKHNLSNLKNSRKTALSESKRLEITKEIFQTLYDNDVKARAIVIGSFTLSRPISPEDLYFGALDFLVERWYMTLKKKNKIGFVIFDTVDRKLENSLRKKFYNYISEGECKYITKSYGFYRECIYPTLLFSDDNHSLLLQAADLIGTSLNSAIVNTLKKITYIDIQNLPEENKFLKIYWPLFMRSPSGKISGWGIKIWD